MNSGDDILSRALAGASIRVESTVFPPFTVDLTPGGSSSQGLSSLVGKLTKPKVTLVKGEEVIVETAPFGDPDEAFPIWPIALAGILLLAVIVVFK